VQARVAAVEVSVGLGLALRHRAQLSGMSVVALNGGQPWLGCASLDCAAVDASVTFVAFEMGQDSEFPVVPRVGETLPYETQSVALALGAAASGRVCFWCHFLAGAGWETLL